MAPFDFEQFAITELLTNSNQVISIVDPSMIVRWTSQSAEAYGIDAVGRSIVDLIHPEDIQQAAQAFDGAAQRAEFRPSLMANTIVSVRLITTQGVIPFEANGRWVTDPEGNDWLIAILQDVTTRYATDAALRTLAAGASEQEAIQAVIAAAREYGGVRGAQILWRSGRVLQTFGDLGGKVRVITDLWGDFADLVDPGTSIELAGSDWGQALPMSAGSERLGTMMIWGRGPAPDPGFLSAAMAPLLSLATVAVNRACEVAELERRANTDQVTGLLNRHAFFSKLDRVIERSAVMYIDLDEFKAVNDLLGHTLGDRLLSVVSLRLVDAAADHTVVGRIGGDEFAVVCESVTPAQTRAVSDRIVQALNQTFVIDGHRVVTGASVGIAYTDKPVSGRDLLDQADKALLEAKARGKGRSVVLSQF